jgi:hypothetical protein
MPRAGVFPQRFDAQQCMRERAFRLLLLTFN